MGDGEFWRRLEHEIESFRAGIRDVRVTPTPGGPPFRDELARRFLFDEPRLAHELVTETADLLRRGLVHVTHPRYFGLFNPSVHRGGIAADALAAAFNPQLAAYSHSPVVQEIERHTLHALGGKLGFDSKNLSASFTSGGAEANLSALLVALAAKFPDTSTRGVAALPAPVVVYLTSESHHSFVKIARMAGLGTNVLREIPTDEQFRLDPVALEAAIDEDRFAGKIPFFVVGTAGTTGAGLVDPLAAIGEIARKWNLWFHVDAAWGGAAVLSPRLAPLLAGIERADSVTWDAHKWLSVPMGAGMFFCRHPEAVRSAFAVSTSYMPGGAVAGAGDPYAETVQWSRRAIGLKVFLTLSEHGLGGMTERIEHQAEMGDRLRERLRAAGWAVVNDTSLPVVCFTHPELRSGRRDLSEMVRSIQDRGRAWISDVVLGGRERVLRACITSFETRDEDLAVLVEEVERARG